MSASQALARRAVACKAWRWMAGMLVLSSTALHGPARIESLDGCDYGMTVIPHENGPIFAKPDEWAVLGEFPREHSVPDLDDPATLGCLLALVREAWGRPAISTKKHRVLGWIVKDHGDPVDAGDFLKSVACDTEASALVAALEAAP